MRAGRVSVGPRLGLAIKTVKTGDNRRLHRHRLQAQLFVVSQWASFPIPQESEFDQNSILCKQCLCKRCRRKHLASQTLVGVEDGRSNALLRALGQRIRDLRIERGFSQEGFADRCGVHRTFMGTVERGESNLSFQNIARVATALEIPLSTLFLGLEAKAVALSEPTKKSNAQKR